MAQQTYAHMVNMPKNFLVLRIFQLVFAIILMGLSIFGVIVFPLSSLALTIFTAFSTAITTIYIISAQKCGPSLYNYWAILALEIFCLIFWLVSFAWVASDTGTLAALFADSIDDQYAVAEQTYVGICGSAAGLGALEFIFFIISLVCTSVAIYRHRRNDGHCKYVKDSMPPPPFESNPNTVVPGEKLQMQPRVTEYNTATMPAQGEYYQPQPPVQVNAQMAANQYQHVPQYTQQTPQQFVASPGAANTAPVRA